MEVINHHDVFPLSPPNVEEGVEIFDSLGLLPGEGLREVGSTVSGSICLSNYRLFLVENGQVIVRVPFYGILRTDAVDMDHIKVTTKTGRSFVLAFTDNAHCTKWLCLLTVTCPTKLEKLFAFYYYAHIQLSSSIIHHLPLEEKMTVARDVEFNRMQFSQAAWQITDINKEFGVCATYPQFHVIPRSITDNNITKIAGFRSLNRFPSVVWRSQSTGAVIIRCAQPCVGIMLWRNAEDERFVMAVLNSCAQNPGKTNAAVKTSSPRLLIVDARHYGAAQLNRIKGGGFEFTEYYDRTDITFMSLPNIHSVRDSFEKLSHLYTGKSDLSWFVSLDKCNWLHNLSSLLKASTEIAVAIHRHARPVMVHCTDGWDRTPQLTSLAQLLLDPFYRTFKGFQILIEREWLDFGHKFADRCGHGVTSASADERSPVFIQWLDCVHQLLHQFPKAFEFNETYLVKLSMHVYSTMFGTFLCNSSKERLKERVPANTCSVFNFLRRSSTSWKMVNYLYDEQFKEVLFPSWLLRDMRLWKSIYFSAFSPSGDDSPQTGSDLDATTPIATSTSSTIGTGSAPGVSNGSLTSDDLVASSGGASHGPAAPIAPLRRSHSTADLHNIGTTTTSEHHSDSLPPNGPSANGIGDDIVTSSFTGNRYPENNESYHPSCNGCHPDGSITSDKESPNDSSSDNMVKSGGLMNNDSIDASQSPNPSLYISVSDIVDSELMPNSDGYTTHPDLLTDAAIPGSEEIQLRTSGPSSLAILASRSLDTLSTGSATSSTNSAGVHNGTLGSSTDTLTEGSQSNLIGKSVAAAVYKPIVMNGNSLDSHEHLTNSLAGRTGQDVTCKNVTSSPLPLRSMVASKSDDVSDSSASPEPSLCVPREQREGTSEDERDSVDLLVLDGNTSTRSNGVVVRSLGYGTGSDLSSTPASSGPPTPDNMEETRVWVRSCSQKTSLSAPPEEVNASTPCVPKSCALYDNQQTLTNGSLLSQQLHDLPTGSKTSSRQSRKVPVMPILATTTTTTSMSLQIPEDDDLESVEDEDGLLISTDPVTRHLYHVHRSYSARLAIMKREMDKLRRAYEFEQNRILQSKFQGDDEAISPGLEVTSSVSTSSDASSFDIVDEAESRFTRWVPDQLANTCYLCNVLFTMVTRKHHCRSCGGVFCSTCSDYFHPVPDQQCLDPVRHCRSCYTKAVVPVESPPISDDYSSTLISPGTLSLSSASASNH